MTGNAQNRGRDDVRFFGRVSASVSHEIKNVFAVINEGAGLIGDFVAMTERGMEIDPARLKRVSGTIQDQIRRGDEIVKSMNKFAHTADEPLSDLDLADMVTLTVQLTKRMADMKQVSLTSGDCQPAALRADAFGLVRLVQETLLAVMGAMSPGQSLRVETIPMSAGGTIRIVPSAGIEHIEFEQAASGVDGLSIQVCHQDGLVEMILQPRD